MKAEEGVQMERERGMEESIVEKMVYDFIANTLKNPRRWPLSGWHTVFDHLMQRFQQYGCKIKKLRAALLATLTLLLLCVSSPSLTVICSSDFILMYTGLLFLQDTHPKGQG